MNKGKNYQKSKNMNCICSIHKFSLELEGIQREKKEKEKKTYFSAKQVRICL